MSKLSWKSWAIIIAVFAGFGILMGLMASRSLELQAKVYQDAVRLIENGERFFGTIDEITFHISGGGAKRNAAASWAKGGWKVSISYDDATTGTKRTLSETWNLNDSISEDLKGKGVGLYYFPGNSYLKMASDNHPSILGAKNQLSKNGQPK